MRITDAHHHFWNERMSRYHRVAPDAAALWKDYTPAQLRPQFDAKRVESSVLVQVWNDLPGTEEFLSFAWHYDWIAAVVGWVDLKSPALGDILDRLMKEHTKFKGVRHLWQDELDPAYMLRPDMIRGMKELAGRGLAYDICVKPWNWPYMQRFVDQMPDLRMVIDHIAKPRIHERQFDDWAELMERMAEHPQMHVKLSGLVTEAKPHGWQKEDFQPYIDHLLAVFGAERLMFGSDWPVCLLAAESYGQTFDLAEHLIRNVSETDKAKIMGETCRRFYGID